MTNDTQHTTEEKDEGLVPIKTILALAAANRIGPFRKRVRLQAPAHHEFQQVSAPALRAPSRPKWNYAGTLPDKPVELRKTCSLTLFRSEILKSRLDGLGAEKFITSDTETSVESTFVKGFTFNRNGMRYDIQFFKPVSDWVEENSFRISSSDNPYDFYLGTTRESRPMTTDEAAYALDVIQSELDAATRARFFHVIDRLKKNLPEFGTAEEAKKADDDKLDFCFKGNRDDIYRNKYLFSEEEKFYNKISFSTKKLNTCIIKP